jgi:hypothetical protein
MVSDLSDEIAPEFTVDADTLPRLLYTGLSLTSDGVLINIRKKARNNVSTAQVIINILVFS